MEKINKITTVKVLQETSRLMRHYGLDSDQFIVVLYFYFLRAAKIDFKVISRAVGNELSNYDIHLSVPLNDFPVLRNIHEIVAKYFKKWPENSFFDLARLVEFNTPIDDNVATSEFYEDLIYAFDSSLGKGKSNGILPQGLADALLDSLELPHKARIYNPFAGYASLSQRPYSGGNYVGQEINDLAWCLGAMRLIINGYDFDPDFRREDSIKNWIESEQFDLVAAFPPFNYRISNRCQYESNAKTAEEFVLSRGLRSLKSNGKLLCVVSNGFLSSFGSEKRYRKNLVDSNLVDTIVSFPGGLLNNTGIPFSVIIINKNKSSETIRFHDLNAMISDINKQRSLENRLKIPKDQIDWIGILSKITKDSNSDYSLEVKIEEISDNDYNLNVPRYFVYKGIDDSLVNGRLLAEVSKIIPGDRIGGEKFGKFIRIRDLNDGGIDFTLNFEDIKDSIVPKYAREISESCILVSVRWNTLKPTLFTYSGRSIYLNKDVIALQLLSDKIDPGFLINELQQDYVLEQFLKLQKGGTIPTISKNDLLRIKIDLPPLNEQRAKVQGVFASVAQSNRKKVELQKELLGYKDEAFREFASIKHTFRQYLNALKSNVSGTRKFISNNEGKSITLDSVYSKNLNRTLGEHLASLEGTIDSMSSLITEEVTDQGTAEVLSPEELIKEAQNRFKDPEKFRFEEVFVDHEVFASEEGYMNPFIKITKDGFFRIFSNIVYNAIDHGFKDRTGNLLRTAISFEEETRYVLVEISNNGWPIPEAFTQKHLTTRGEKTSDSQGTGSGGADIKGILEKYNAKLELKKDPEAEFPVTYVLKFPLFTLLDKMGPDKFDFNPDDFDILK